MARPDVLGIGPRRLTSGREGQTPENVLTQPAARNRRVNSKLATSQQTAAPRATGGRQNGAGDVGTGHCGTGLARYPHSTPPCGSWCAYARREQEEISHEVVSSAHSPLFSRLPPFPADQVPFPVFTTVGQDQLPLNHRQPSRFSSSRMEKLRPHGWRQSIV